MGVADVVPLGEVVGALELVIFTEDGGVCEMEESGGGGGLEGDAGVAAGAVGVVGICASGGLGEVVPAVLVGVGSGEERGGKELTVVVLFFPQVAHAVGISIKNGG